MTNILITSAGQRVSLVKAFQNELKKVFPRSKIFTVDLNPTLAPACHISDGFKKICRVTEDSYVNDLLAICKEWQIKLIIPTIDTELKILANHKGLFDENDISVVISDLDFIEKCRDKRIIHEFFEQNNMEIPSPVDKNNLTFPFFIKPFDGSLSKDIFFVENESQLIPQYFSNPKLMFMEYINPKDNSEYTVDTYYDKSGFLKCIVPRKRIFVRSGEINKGVTHKNEIVSYLEKKLPFIKGAKGCLTMQFFLNNTTKRIVAIEINPRFGGGFPLSYLAGANFPKWIIEEYMLGNQISFFEGWENNLLMLRYDDEVLVHGYEE